MLRISVHDNPESTTFQLEGTLVGPWVQEAKECWQRTHAGRREPAICFDLAGLTSIDAAGKEFLRAMHTEGAKLRASGCLMRAVVAEITGAPIPDCGCS
jgi:anti-anti-sigma regulatory factor